MYIRRVNLLDVNFSVYLSFPSVFLILIDRLIDFYNIGGTPLKWEVAQGSERQTQLVICP